MGVTLYTSRVVLATLGVEDFGIYNVVGGVITMFAFLNGVLSGATSRFFTVELGRNDYKQLNKVFSCSLVTHLIIAIVILILAETVGLWFLLNKMVIPPDRMLAAQWVFQFSIFSCMFNVMQVPYNAVIIAHERMNVYAYISIVEVILKLLIVYLLLISSLDKLIFYAALIFVLQVLTMLFYRFYCVSRHAECHFHFYKDKNLYKGMLSYAGFDMIGGLSTLAQGQGLNLLLNLFFGPAINAARGIAYQVQGAITQFSGNFMMAVRPQIIKLYAQGKIEEMMVLVRNSSVLSFILVSMLSFPIIVEMDYVLTLWLGTYPDYTASFSIIVLINNLLSSMRRPRTTVFHATGFIKLTNMVTGSILCLAFPIAYFLLKMGYNPNSVFWGMLLTTCMADVSNLLILKRYINYSIKDFVVLVHGKCLLIFLISSVVPVFLHYKLNTGLERLILVAITSAFSIAILSYTIVLTNHQREIVINKIKKVGGKWRR
jgi:O-antigen/teichoic acid export membrane protein